MALFISIGIYRYILYIYISISIAISISLYILLVYEVLARWRPLFPQFSHPCSLFFAEPWMLTFWTVRAGKPHRDWLSQNLYFIDGETEQERDLPLATWQVNFGKVENGTSQAFSIPGIPGPICQRQGDQTHTGAQKYWWLTWGPDKGNALLKGEVESQVSVGESSGRGPLWPRCVLA